MANLGATTPLPPATTLMMRAVIARQNQSALDQLIADQQNPHSAEYHHWLAPGEFTDRFGPTLDQLAPGIRVAGLRRRASPTVDQNRS